MSLEYLMIEGYAVKFDSDVFLYEYDYAADVFSALGEKIHGRWSDYTPIRHAISKDEEEEYIIYKPNPYFKMHDIEKSFSCEADIAREMYRVLKPALAPGVTEKYFIDSLEHVNVYGDIYRGDL